MATNTAWLAPPARRHASQQVHYLYKSITYSPENTETVIGVIPANATVIGGGVHVTTAFNALSIRAIRPVDA